MNPLIIVGAIALVILVIVVAVLAFSSKPKTVVSATGASIAPASGATIVETPRAIMGKTVTIYRKSGSGGIQLSEVIIRGPGGTRLVPTSAVSSSKFSLDGKFDPAKLIDANFGTSARTAEPSMAGEVPTITLDMGKDVAIGTIEIAAGTAKDMGKTSGLAVKVTDSSGRETFSRTITADRPYYAYSTAGAALPHPPMPMFTGGLLESFSARNNEVIGRFVQSSSLPKIFDGNGLQLNAASVVATKGSAPAYTVDLGSNRGIGRINLEGRGGEHNIVVKSARGDVTYTAQVKNN